MPLELSPLEFVRQESFQPHQEKIAEALATWPQISPLLDELRVRDRVRYTHVMRVTNTFVDMLLTASLPITSEEGLIGVGICLSHDLGQLKMPDDVLAYDWPDEKKEEYIEIMADHPNFTFKMLLEIDEVLAIGGLIHHQYKLTPTPELDQQYYKAQHPIIWYIGQLVAAADIRDASRTRFSQGSAMKSEEQLQYEHPGVPAELMTLANESHRRLYPLISPYTAGYVQNGVLNK